MEQKTDLAIVIPIYNPHENWDKELENNIDEIKKQFNDIILKFVIVNDGSSFDLSDKMISLKRTHDNIHYIHYQENKGKGFAVKTGLREVSARNYIYTDYDFPFGIEKLIDFYRLIQKEDVDIVLSKRSKKYYKVLPFKRRLISRTLHFFSFFLLNFKNYDTQSGLKAINEKAKMILINSNINHFLFELEFIKKAKKNTLKIESIEVEPRPDIVFSNFSSKVLIEEFKSFIKLIFS